MPTTTAPTAAPIAETFVRENIIRAIGDVFQTMLGYGVQPAAAAPPDSAVGSSSRPSVPAIPAPLVVGTVGFIGKLNGLIYLYFDESLALRCTGDMLCMGELELAETGAESVNDAIGELTNMVVGSFKNCLCDAGYPCKLTIPSILRGSNFCVEPISHAQRHVYYFQCHGHQMVADIHLKSGE